jgi:hypothetical protein
VQRQLVDCLSAETLGGVQRQFDERRARKQRRAADGVVGKPGMCGQGKPAGEHGGLGTSERDGRAEQRMVGRRQTRGGDVRGGEEAVFQPVALVLEGIGGQRCGL